MMDILTLADYKVYIGDCLAALGELIHSRRYSMLLVVVDENTERDCLPRLRAALEGQALRSICISAGEQHKTLDTCAQIWGQMMQLGADRRALCINLGGGVIGDMGGFCAGTFKRGMDFVQVPTTLLAQVDASVGGKLGIDFLAVKNSIGIFCNPQAVFIDPAFLGTLPARELRSGLAEVIKHSLIADAGQWAAISGSTDWAATDWAALLLPSVGIKQRIVEADPHERGLRKALNFGHTIGHAIEGHALEGERPLLHGEAIAIGMVCEAYLSQRQAGLPEAALAEISRFLLGVYGHYDLAEADFDAYLALMANDKKNEGGRINFSLLPSIGAVRVDEVCSPEDIVASLRYYQGLGAGIGG